MPRANRYFIPGLVWHVTHRCHRREFLLKFARDRDRYRYWLYEARRRFGLCVLDYVITSNHIHLLAKDTGGGAIARSIQLAAGRVAQEYNTRKERRGAFWEDRYHATAVESGEHLLRCMAYIDLNMVRAGAVADPAQWHHGGHREILAPPRRYRLVDRKALCELAGVAQEGELEDACRAWVADALAEQGLSRQAAWTESVALGSAAFAESVKARLGASGRFRDVEQVGSVSALRQPPAQYKAGNDGENGRVALENTVPWDSV